jgi:hypothetical protein
MRLASAMIDQTLEQFEAEAIPDNHPAVPQLNKIFGDHTFFLDGNGLNIVEPSDASPATAPTWQVVKVASWSDAAKTSLAPHEPEPTDIIFAAEPDGRDDTA